MLGQQYFDRRFSDLSHLSPIPYLSGDGELGDASGSIRVEWELTVPITGEGLLVFSTRQVLDPSRMVSGRQRFNEWSLNGTCHQDNSRVTAEGIVLPSMSFSTADPEATYFSHFRSLDLRPEGAQAPDSIQAMVRNLTFLGLEPTARGNGWALDKFHVAVAGRHVYFHLSPHRDAIKGLIDSERIDRALMSEIRVPLAAGENLDHALAILETAEWLSALATLNRTFSPLILLLSRGRPCGWRVLDIGSDDFRTGGVIDNDVIPAGISGFIEATFDRFNTLNSAFNFRQFIDMALVMCRQRHLEFRLASLIMAFEYFCTNYLTHRGEHLDPETNIQQKLYMINRYLRFIPRDLLDDTLRRDIRNPLFHQGAIIGSSRDALWQWFTEYWELLLQVVFVVLHYQGQYISPVTNDPATVPAPGGGATP
jgi:hypothetical protein